MNSYEIYQFTYIDKSSRSKFVVYARTLKVANEIIDIENTDNTIFHWIPKKIGFIKKVVSKIPPYELEMQQLECADNRLTTRNHNANKNI